MNPITTQTFWNLFTGMDNPASFLGITFFALLGGFLSLLLHSTTRDISSPSTPVLFKWWFLFFDNIKRILTTVICIYIALRFTPQLLGIKITEFWALAIGFGNDKLIQQIKDKTNWLDNKKTV